MGLESQYTFPEIMNNNEKIHCKAHVDISLALLLLLCCTI